MAVFYGRQIQPPAATPFPSSPKAVRAFVTTATSSLVNDRGENGCVLSVSYADSIKIEIDDSGSDDGSCGSTRAHFHRLARSL
jgi:hypothetical protein